MSALYALVTGCSSGIGLEMTYYLLEEGYVVFGGSRSYPDISHPHFIPLNVDVRNEQSVIKMFNEISKQAIGLHVIVNSAGVFEANPVVKMPSESFKNHLETNVLGPFHIFKHSFPLLIERKSHIINISSMAAKRGYAQASAYCASKWALSGLLESVREEWKNLGIRFTTLVPGPIDTPLWEKMESAIDREKMLDPEDFIHVFEMVLKSPLNMVFREIVFQDKDCFMS